jgi:hypothetical protein
MENIKKDNMDLQEKGEDMQNVKLEQENKLDDIISENVLLREKLK